MTACGTVRDDANRSEITGANSASDPAGSPRPSRHHGHSTAMRTVFPIAGVLVDLEAVREFINERVLLPVEPDAQTGLGLQRQISLEFTDTSTLSWLT